MRPVARQTSILRTTLTRPPKSSIPQARLIASLPRASIAHSEAPVPFGFRKVARMSTQSTQSQACCNTPAVVSKGYQAKGDYIEVDGLKTCKSYTVSLHTIASQHNPRCHRVERRQTRHPRRLRHLRLLQPDTPRRRYPRLY